MRQANFQYVCMSETSEHVCMSQTAEHACMYVCLRQLSVYVCMSQILALKFAHKEALNQLKTV